jgi:hypothetical protein
MASCAMKSAQVSLWNKHCSANQEHLQQRIAEYVQVLHITTRAMPYQVNVPGPLPLVLVTPLEDGKFTVHNMTCV